MNAKQIISNSEELMDYLSMINRMFLKKVGKVWLIGSRANKRSKENSDWEVLLEGDLSVVHEMSKDPQKYRIDNIDILIVFDGNNFRSPFEEKKGSKSSWHWKEIEGRYFYRRGKNKDTQFINGLDEAILISDFTK
jgi:predicted nucleotidyltransferase